MKYTLELEDQMVNVLAEALGNAPFKVAAPVFQEIQRQVAAQNAQADPRGAAGAPVNVMPPPTRQQRRATARKAGKSNGVADAPSATV